MKSHDHASQTPLYDCNNALYICCFLDLFYSILCCIRLAFYPVSSVAPQEALPLPQLQHYSGRLFKSHLLNLSIIFILIRCCASCLRSGHSWISKTMQLRGEAQPQRGRHQGRASCRLGASGKRPSWKSRSHRFLDRATYRGLLNIPRSLGWSSPVLASENLCGRGPHR